MRVERFAMAPVVTWSMV